MKDWNESANPLRKINRWVHKQIGKVPVLGSLINSDLRKLVPEKPKEGGRIDSVIKRTRERIEGIPVLGSVLKLSGIAAIATIKKTRDVLFETLTTPKPKIDKDDPEMQKLHDSFQDDFEKLQQDPFSALEQEIGIQVFSEGMYRYHRAYKDHFWQRAQSPSHSKKYDEGCFLQASAVAKGKQTHAYFGDWDENEEIFHVSEANSYFSRQFQQYTESDAHRRALLAEGGKFGFASRGGVNAVRLRKSDFPDKAKERYLKKDKGVVKNLENFEKKLWQEKLEKAIREGYQQPLWIKELEDPRLSLMYYFQLKPKLESENVAVLDENYKMTEVSSDMKNKIGSETIPSSFSDKAVPIMFDYKDERFTFLFMSGSGKVVEQKGDEKKGIIQHGKLVDIGKIVDYMKAEIEKRDAIKAMQKNT
jgi:hypothetical protein